MSAGARSARGAVHPHRDPARPSGDQKRRAGGGSGAATRVPRAPPGAARGGGVSAGAHPLASSLPSRLSADDTVAAVDLGTNSTRLLVADVEDSQLDRDRASVDDHADGRRWASAALLLSHHARAAAAPPEFWPGLERQGQGLAAVPPIERCGKRRGVSRGDRMELWVHDAAALRGGEEAALIKCGMHQQARDPLDGRARHQHRRRLDRARGGGRRQGRSGDEPRHRLRAPRRALSLLESAFAARARRRERVRALAPPGASAGERDRRRRNRDDAGDTRSRRRRLRPGSNAWPSHVACLGRSSWSGLRP